MRIFIIILAIIIVLLFIFSIIFNFLTVHLVDKISIRKSSNVYFIDTSHELYGKYKKYEKLSHRLFNLGCVLAILHVVLCIITKLMGWL